MVLRTEFDLIERNVLGLQRVSGSYERKHLVQRLGDLASDLFPLIFCGSKQHLDVFALFGHGAIIGHPAGI